MAGNLGPDTRVAPTATAYYHRDAPYNLMMLSSWEDADATDRNIQWTREFYAAVRPQLSAGVYVNDLVGDEGEARVREAYGENYLQLAAIKAKYDPTNFFRQNQNITPSA